MDTTTWLILGGLAIAAAITVLVALNRSWGNFPGRAGVLPPASASAPGVSQGASDQAPAPWPDMARGMAAQPAVASEAAGQASGLVPIEHPLVRRSAEQALGRGGSIARYITRQGDQLFFDFSQIDDPAQRQEAYDLMRSFNAGQDVDVAAMLKMVNRLFSS